MPQLRKNLLAQLKRSQQARRNQQVQRQKVNRQRARLKQKLRQNLRKKQQKRRLKLAKLKRRNLRRKRKVVNYSFSSEEKYGIASILPEGWLFFIQKVTLQGYFIINKNRS
ncbi:MAG TPA: hypothetical protein EYG71_03000 [Leucothrix sp.]|nr:hypothetical protein [Leucothrix sp.]